MARTIVQAAVAVALLAVVLQYSGITPPIPGLLQVLFPRLGGAASLQNINAPKLLADLNSDILGSEDAGGVGAGDSHDTRVARAASAALSVMYLASLPGLKEQVKQSPGIIESLVRRVMSLDLQEAQRTALQQQRQQQQGHGQVELLSSALLAVAKLAAGDRPLQAWLLGEDSAGATAGGSAAKRMPRGALLARLEEILQSGVPAWQAAASMLVAGLSGPDRDHPLVGGWAAEQAEALVHVGRSLVEAGAHFNSSDALLSGSHLLEVVAAQSVGQRVLLRSEAPNLLVQVVLSYAGTNSSSSMVGCAARLLYRLVAVTEGTTSGRAAARVGDRAEAAQLAQNLTARGLIAPLVREVRLGQPASLGRSLELLWGLVRQVAAGRGGAERGGSRQPDDGGGNENSSSDGSSSGDAAREAVGAGILSLCAQLLFKESPDEQAHGACCHIVRHTLAHWKARKGVVSAGDAARDDPLLEGLDDEDNEDRGPFEEAICARGPDGRKALADGLMRVLSETDLPDLHNAVLEACRDVAPARPAAAALVEAGIIPHLAALLSHNTTKSREEGSHDAASIAWMLQSQRSSAALVALLALQPELRGRLVAEGALTGLATSMRVHSGPSADHRAAGAGRKQQQLGGLPAQVRVTAAAALVPLLGEDGRYTRLAVAAGVLEPVVDMHFSGRAQEGQVAGRVMRALASGDPDVAEMFRSLGIEL